MLGRAEIASQKRVDASGRVVVVDAAAAVGKTAVDMGSRTG